MAVHGRYKEPCLRCGAKIQRIRYASNETNYCPHARRMESCWPIARYRAFCARTGRGLRKNSNS